ncbi:MAG: hypothetical protein P4M07_04035 [Xanthobacteraceae bacterium]|nr:hypothetical protein [Xanthobacteraceae bacterium]
MKALLFISTALLAGTGAARAQSNEPTHFGIRWSQPARGVVVVVPNDFLTPYTPTFIQDRSSPVYHPRSAGNGLRPDDWRDSMNGN